MKDTYQVGDTLTFRLQSTPEMSARQYQESSPDVFATPHLLGAVEAAAARLMERWLDDGEMSVGGHVELQHTAPTPLGWEIRADATLVEAKGKKFVFQVECFDETEKIGSARHTRFVIDAAGFGAMVEKKSRQREVGG